MTRNTQRRRTTQRRHHRGAGRVRGTPAVLAAAALLLAGCIATPSYRPVGYVTPPDPPGLPQRKPTPPASVAAWDAAPLETSGQGGGQGGPAVAPPSVADVEVQELAPRRAAETAVQAEPQRVAQTAMQTGAAAQPATQPAAQSAAQSAAVQVAEVPADGTYVVARGDSLYGIARRFGLPILAVIDANRMQPPFALRVGQRLDIPQAQVHVVADGDTVFNIAQRYNVDRSELVRLNDIQPPYTIPLGQKLILPQPDSAAMTPTTVAYSPQDDVAATLDASVAEQAAPPPAAPEAPAKAQAAKPARTSAETRAALANLPPRASSTFLWPVQGPVLSSFGAKEGGEHNDGINIAAPRGTAVRAAENGVVAYAGEELKGFGKLLLVKHDGGWVTAYAHNDDLLVRAGDRVERGQTIARVGTSGNVGRPQLHFEVRRGTRAVNPETNLSPRTAAVMN